ncbi:leucine-rich repeat extensin-like protein 5 [Anopheles stephensi]|uniref:leucine-rich repeat extensin-like protein 5 n=1 Tax=Anopheles stephensi TaxID=30069 RepID=UPI001658895E|nr:leucine-rich repeat extensin-like protein 5 [Anopheles stephensi]
MTIVTVSCCGRSNTVPLHLGALLLLLVLHLSLSSANHYYEVMGEPSVTYELVCPENEQLHDTMPCCEPTCDNDCSSAKCSKAYVRQPTCVCKEGYVRHKNKCIPPQHCPPKPPAPVTCAENEELLPSPPSCEPTCTEDCAGRPVHSRYVDQPTCVCRKGYRRHKGKCIRVDQCPSCGPYATLKANAPCCEPTCDNDCSNVLCLEGYQSDEPVCVCQDGYVKHNSTCIKRELCPQTVYPVPKQFCRCSVKRRPKGRVPVPVKYVEIITQAPCSCYQQQVVNDGRVVGDHFPSDTYSPAKYPAMSYVSPGYVSTTCAPPLQTPPPCQQPSTYPPLYYGPPVTHSPPSYVPGPYVPPPTCAPPPPPPPPPPVYTPPPPPPVYTPPPPPTTTYAPPKQYYQPPVYAAPGKLLPPPPPPPYAYTFPPVVETTTCASVTVQPSYAYPPADAVPLKPYYQQPPSSYQDQPYYAIPALKQCSCNINGSPVTSSPPCACGNSKYPPQMQTYNRPPISYNVATPSTTTAAPTTTLCPPVVCNQCNQAQYLLPGSYRQDQPYLQQQSTTPGPLPVDVSYIPLPGSVCSNADAVSGTGTGGAALVPIGTSGSLPLLSVLV